MSLKNKKKEGFTLIELVLGLLIAGLIGSLVITQFRGARESAYRSVAEDQIKSVKKAVTVWISSQDNIETARTHFSSPTTVATHGANSAQASVGYLTYARTASGFLAFADSDFTDTITVQSTSGFTERWTTPAMSTFGGSFVVNWPTPYRTSEVTITRYGF